MHADITHVEVSDLKVSDLLKWFKKVDCFKELMTTFNENTVLTMLALQIERMNLIFKVLTGENSLMINKGALS